MNERMMTLKKHAALVKEERTAKTKELIMQPGHPLQLFTKENQALALAVEKIKTVLQTGDVDKNALEGIRDLSIHYAKKGDLLYPLLKVKYEITGPSDLMWTEDDEVRDEITKLLKTDVVDAAWKKRLEDVIIRVEKMMYMEANILFPGCAVNFTEEEWMGIYQDQKDYARCFGVKSEYWEMAEKKKELSRPSVSGEEVILAGGHMTVEQLTALLNTLPFEITFVDANDINRFFNEGPKDFKRPQMAIDRDVFSCHPPKIEEKVRHIISELRAGTVDEVPIWMEKNGKCLLVKYMAVRDQNKNYLGTVELVQNMDFAKEHFGGNRLP